jgi:anti-sigma regulatory factor (Ser/Thr protein kinase)
LEGDGLARLQDDVLLVAGELVTNAVVHAATEIELSYHLDASALEVGVSDRNPRPPRLSRGPDGKALTQRGLSPNVLGGRGLLIVSQLADEWGVTETREGKRVWARWSVTP